MYKAIRSIKGIEIREHHIQIVQLLSEGYMVTEVGQKMFLGKRTVDTHIQFLRNQLGCKNTAHLVAYFFINRLLPIPELQFNER